MRSTVPILCVLDPCWPMAVRHAIYLRKTANRSTTTQIYEGTNQIQRMVMARHLLK